MPLAQFRRGFLARRQIAAECCDVHALGGERGGDHAADAAVRAGDDGFAARESEFHDDPLLNAE